MVSLAKIWKSEKNWLTSILNFLTKYETFLMVNRAKISQTNKKPINLNFEFFVKIWKFARG